MAYSDYNLSSISASVVASKVYNDLSISVIHPATGDALVARDLEAIKNSIKNIVLTPIGTRPFFPEFGTNVDNLLFENFNVITATVLEDEILNGVTKFEPRISNISVSAVPNEEQHVYKISITFSPYFGGVYSLEFTLNRIR